MFKITMAELAEVCQGTWLPGAQDFENIPFSGISIDSRTVKKGDLFIAIRGERFDGHDFVEDALHRGAAGVVAAADAPLPWKDAGESRGPVLVVKDTLTALQQISAWWRQNFHIPVAAITGSSGKTTTKDILASLLSTAGRVHFNRGNQNNEIGVPLTLLGLDHTHEVCVLEMGMRGLGEIARLCEVARPTCGIITNVGSTHFERLGSVENIARAKGELAQSLPSHGFILLNEENEWSQFISGMTGARTVFFGFGSGADIRASEVDYGSESTQFTLTAGGISQRLRVPLWGEHNVYNCLAAIGLYLSLGFSREKLQEGLDNLTISGMRLEKTPGIKGSVIINDAYNANPTSMLAALEVLKQVRGKRRIAVLGDMLELGDIGEAEHRKVGAVLAQGGVHILVTVGSLAACISDAALASGMEKSRVFHSSAPEDAAAYLQQSICEGDVVLVKGSRGMKLERIVAALAGPGESHV